MLISSAKIVLGNVKNDQRGMAETFYLSNVVPQNSNNNAGFWYRLEAYCRALARRYNGVYVFSGPLFLPETELDGRKFVKYQVSKTYITVCKYNLTYRNLSRKLGLI